MFCFVSPSCVTKCIDPNDYNTVLLFRCHKLFEILSVYKIDNRLSTIIWQQPCLFTHTHRYQFYCDFLWNKLNSYCNHNLLHLLNHNQLLWWIKEKPNYFLFVVKNIHSINLNKSSLRGNTNTPSPLCVSHWIIHHNGLHS